MPTNQPVSIREVWRENLDSEFSLIRSIIDEYPFISMHTEFPGTVLQSITHFDSVFDSTYASMKANVDLMDLVQLGLTFSDGERNLPMENSVWQFNFCEFDPCVDVHNEESVELLRESGVDFERNMTHGISACRFAELLISSGVVLNSSVHWITFHGSYDFAYLLSVLTGTDLPETLKGFKTLIRVYFPVLFDIKHLIKYCEDLCGGLNQVGKLLGVERYGNSHLAGSDSHLTLNVFMELKRLYFHGVPHYYEGVLFGLEG